MRQLILPVQLRDDATFANFYSAQNQASLQYLQGSQDNYIYLSGKSYCGLTHLLQALCHQKKRSLYVPLRNYTEFSPDILLDIAELDLIALDDIEAISGEKKWEEAIFHLFNQIQKQLIISSHIIPLNLNIKLPDLKSRLQSMLLLTIESLSDEEKLKALQWRAEKRGFLLSTEVGNFLLNHTSRDMAHLFNILEKLDAISLEEKRKLTIPLVKKVL
jgi:DnaA family protein